MKKLFATAIAIAFLASCGSMPGVVHGQGTGYSTASLTGNYAVTAEWTSLSGSTVFGNLIGVLKFDGQGGLSTPEPVSVSVGTSTIVTCYATAVGSYSLTADGSGLWQITITGNAPGDGCSFSTASVSGVLLAAQSGASFVVGSANMQTTFSGTGLKQ